MQRQWLTLLAGLFAFSLSVVADAGRLPRDFSGDAMQRHDSQMMASPMNRIPSLLGMTLWPFNPYYYAPPSLTVINVEINLPSAERPSALPVAPAVRPIFWTNRCGVFVEIKVSPTTNLIEEETKPC
jgi:hypothetical protein